MKPKHSIHSPPEGQALQPDSQVTKHAQLAYKHTFNRWSLVIKATHQAKIHKNTMKLNLLLAQHIKIKAINRHTLFKYYSGIKFHYTRMTAHHGMSRYMHRQSECDNANSRGGLCVRWARKIIRIRARQERTRRAELAGGTPGRIFLGRVDCSVQIADCRSPDQ